MNILNLKRYQSPVTRLENVELESNFMQASYVINQNSHASIAQQQAGGSFDIDIWHENVFQ